MLVVSSAPLCFAQQPVVTLGIPSAKSAATVSKSTPTLLGASDTVLPPIRINAFGSVQNHSADVSIAERMKGEPFGLPEPLWQSLVPRGTPSDVSEKPGADTAKPGDALVGAPGMFLSAFADSQSSRIAAAPIAVPPINGLTVRNPKLIPKPPQLSDMLAGPQLSPAKWVHQPLVARQVRQDDSVDAVSPQSLSVRGDARSSPRPNAQARPLTEIRRAAMRQRATRTPETLNAPIQTEPIQPGYSIEAIRKTAMELIAEAQLKLDIRAYLSAEEKAKKALELIAQSIDTHEQSSFATRDLKVSLTAIREAEDFVGKFGLVDGDTISRMVRSHATEILKPYDTSNLNGLAAADVYLDWSRRCLTPLAVADPLAAEAIRVMAQAHRMRDDGTPFGLATSVHLIRAAVEGAPDNRQLRTDYETTLQLAGLSGHSKAAQAGKTVPNGQSGALVSQVAADWQLSPDRPIALATALDGQPKREVRIVEVSPEQFATISPATAGPPGTPHAHSMPANNHQHADQTNYQSSPYHSAPLQGPDNSVKARLSRAFDPITRHLR